MAKKNNTKKWEGSKQEKNEDSKFPPITSANPETGDHTKGDQANPLGEGNGNQPVDDLRTLIEAAGPPKLPTGLTTDDVCIIS